MFHSITLFSLLFFLSISLLRQTIRYNRAEKFSVQIARAVQKGLYWTLSAYSLDVIESAIAELELHNGRASFTMYDYASYLI